MKNSSRKLKNIVAVFACVLCSIVGTVGAAGFDAEKGLAEARAAQFRQKSPRVLPVAVYKTSAAGVKDAENVLKLDGKCATLVSDGSAKPYILIDVGEASLSGYAVVHVKSAKGNPVLRLAYANYDGRLLENGDYDEKTRASYMSRDVELPVLPANINRHELYTIGRAGKFLAPLHQPQFRYARIQLDTPGEVELDGVEWIVGDFYDRQDLAGYFNSSDPELNRHWQIGVWTSQIATIRDVDAWRALDGWLLPRKLEKGPDCGFLNDLKKLPETGSFATTFELRTNPIRENAVGFALFAKGPDEGLFFSLDETGLVRWIRRWKGRDDILREQRLPGVKLEDSRPYALEVSWRPTDDDLFASQAIDVELKLDGKSFSPFTYYHSGIGDKFGFWTPKGFWPLFDFLEIRDAAGKRLFRDDFNDAKLAAWNFTRAEPFVADGATRDRLIWSGDLWWAGRNLYYSLADQYGMRDSLKLLARCTTPEGFVHACPYAEMSAPKSGDYGMFESDEFAAWFVPVLHDYYLYTADRKTLDVVWPSLVKLMGYLDGMTDQAGIFQPRALTSKHATSSYLQDGDVAHRCYLDILLYWCRKCAAELAREHGDTALAETWSAGAEKTRKAVFANYGQNGYFTAQPPCEPNTYHWDNKLLKMVQKPIPADDTMANAIALASHLVSPEQARIVAQHVNDYKPVIKFAVMGARGKAEYGMGDEAWKMIITNNWSQMTKPSWHAPACTPEGMPILGTTWECEDYSHPDVALAGFISTAFLGVIPLEPGFRKFKFEPNPYAKLQWAEGRVPTPFGPIDARWERQGEGFRYVITVPKGTTCIIRNIPYGPGTYDLCQGGKVVDEFAYSAGDVRCRLTWTGPATGWRLQTAAEGSAFCEDGAVQKLARFMEEKAPSSPQAFWVEEKDGTRLCRAADGSSVTIAADGRLDVRSPAGKIVTESVVVRTEGAISVLSGRLRGHEPVYGLGERLDRLNKRGQRFAVYTSDGYNNSGTTYMAIPMFSTPRGGGVFVNLYERMMADFDVAETNVWRMEVEKRTLDVYLFAKDRIPDVLAAYTELSGHSDVPEAWNAGPVICRYYPDLTRFEGPFACSFRGMTLRGYGLKEMMERHIAEGAKPSAVIVEGGGYTDLFGNPSKRDELKKMSVYLKEKGIRLMIYMCSGSHGSSKAPGFRPDFDVSASVTANGVVVQADTKLVPSRYANGVNPDLGKGRPLPYADITDPSFWDWYVNVVWKDLVDIGVSGVKIDFCELMPEEGENPGDVAVHYKWRDPSVFAGTAVHHAYPTFFISKFYRAMSELTAGKGGFMVLSRGGGIGSQRNPYLWAGDQHRRFDKLDDQLLAVLNSGMSGVPFMTYDMAGYQYSDGCVEPDGEIDGKPVSVRRSRTLDAAAEAAVFRRGVEFTAFTTCVQSHGYVRNSYDFDAETRAHYRRYMELHASLSNVFARLNREAAATGVPPVRPLVYRWPDDPKVWNVFDEFLLGDSILVAPSFSSKPRTDVYLPAGDWQRVPGLEIPVYVERGSKAAALFRGESPR